MRLIKSLFLLIFLPNIAFSAGVPISGGRQPFSVSTQNGNLQVYSVMGTAHSGTYFRDPIVSTASPSVSAKVPMPFANKGGTSSDATLTWPVDTQKTTNAAAKALEAGLAGLSSGNGYVAAASVACAFLCQPAIEALTAWGAEQFKKNPDGSFSVVSPDTSATVETSDGKNYTVNLWGQYVSGYSPSSACSALGTATGAISSTYDPRWGGYCDVQYYVNPELYPGWINGAAPGVVAAGPSDCLVGQKIVNGVCNGEALKETPIETYLQSNYTGKGWDHYWAGITAGLVAAGVNVFTDGTGSTITGPAVVPVSTSETRTPINLSPGTTTPAPPGTTGPTDSGTQTTTTTTTAHNTYRPGSSGSGPSMETKTQTQTTTTITNNVTNITNIVSETTTEKDEAPEENATDTPLTGVPELYKQKYPDGLTGVFNDFKSRINTTSFVQLIGALTPNISGAGTCPSWTIDLTWTPGGSMGTHTIGQDFCWIWPILKIIVIVTTLFTVRRLIFGG